MKNILYFIFLLTSITFSQTKEINITMEKVSINSDIQELLDFENINYLKIKFCGEKLIGKKYELTVKEIWKGKVKSESEILNSETFPFEDWKKINDTILEISVISKLSKKKNLKMVFKTHRMKITKNFKATNSNNYHFTDLIDSNKEKVSFGKTFYLLSNALMYEYDGTFRTFVGGINNGDVLKWGEKYGIKHYLIFEMKFE